MSDNNDLPEGAGGKRLLKPRGNFDQHPHLWTYFIRGPDGIKIGQSGSPRVRMASLQSAHGSKLELILSVPYGQLSESDAHEMFKHLRLHGEWFRPEQDLLDFIDALKTQAGIPTLPALPARPAKSKPAIIGQLHAIRRAHGADTPMGYCCSNLAEMIENMDGYKTPPWATHEMQTLPWMIKREMKRFEQLKAAAH